MWDWMNDYGAALSALAAIGTAVIAVFTLLRAVRDSRDRTRPYMVAELRLAKDSGTAIDFVIRNAGVSLARNVKVSFTPEIEVPEEGGPYVTPLVVERYRSSIPCVAPGQEFRNVWWAGRMGRGNDLENGEPTPDEFTVDITYVGARKRQEYAEKFPLSVKNMLATTESISSTSFKGRLKTIDASLKTVGDSLRGVDRSLNTTARALQQREEPDKDDQKASLRRAKSVLLGQEAVAPAAGDTEG